MLKKPFSLAILALLAPVVFAGPTVQVALSAPAKPTTLTTSTPTSSKNTTPGSKDSATSFSDSKNSKDPKASSPDSPTTSASAKGASAANKDKSKLSIGTKTKGSAKGWKIMQRSTYAGEQSCFITPLGTKIQSKLVTTVVKLPSKSVLLYNDDTKGFCQLTYEQWMAQMRRKIVGNSRTITKGETGNVSGIKAVQYRFENTIQGKRKVTEEYWTAADSEIPTKLTAPLSDLADLPASLGLPLKIIQYKADGSKNIMLDTMSLTKVKVDASIYDTPDGYEDMHDPITLVLGGR